MRLGVSRAIIDGNLVDGDIEIENGRVAAVGVSATNGSGLAAPGFVDLQVNGFAGIDFAAADPADYDTAGAALAASGVTAYQPTLITLPEADAVEALRSLAAHQPDRPGPHVIGMHLEGPFLSPLRAGAHDPSSMMEPDLALAERLLDAGPVSMMTLAPERPGALELIEYLVGRGIVVSCGHSDATAGETHAAFEGGASAITHLFGAQRPVHHRDPGIAGAGLIRPDVTVSIILDGFHLDPDIVRLVMSAPARVALITDAIAAAGQPEGTYPLGDRTVIVNAGSARLENGTLAGSVLTMDAAVRNLIDIGADLIGAVEAATSVPASAVGREDLGRLTVGSAADIVVLTDDLGVQRTLVGGVEAFSAR